MRQTIEPAAFRPPSPAPRRDPGCLQAPRRRRASSRSRDRSQDRADAGGTGEEACCRQRVRAPRALAAAARRAMSSSRAAADPLSMKIQSSENRQRLPLRMFDRRSGQRTCRRYFPWRSERRAAARCAITIVGRNDAARREAGAGRGELRPGRCSVRMAPPAAPSSAARVAASIDLFGIDRSGINRRLLIIPIGPAEHIRDPDGRRRSAIGRIKLGSARMRTNGRGLRWSRLIGPEPGGAATISPIQFSLP